MKNGEDKFKKPGRKPRNFPLNKEGAGEKRKRVKGKFQLKKNKGKQLGEKGKVTKRGGSTMRTRKNQVTRKKNHRINPLFLGVGGTKEKQPPNPLRKKRHEPEPQGSPDKTAKIVTKEHFGRS